MNIYNQIREYPGVESAVMIENYQYPLSGSSNSSSIRYDTLSAGYLRMAFLQDGEFFKVFGIRDARTGQIPDHKNHTTKTVYLTEDVLKKLFHDGEGVGKEVYQNYSKDSTGITVAGIMENFKFRSTEQPRTTAFFPLADMEFHGAWSAQICFRIRDGISKQKFMEQFKQELAPRMQLGNLYFLNLSDFENIYKQSEFQQGTTNTLRLQTALATFFLICTFLGIAGTFWLQSNSRRGEIGLRMAMGSTRKQIMKEFLTESWLIATVAWFIGILFVLQRVHFTGFAEKPKFENDAYLQNQFWPHFLIVSAIVYLLIILISFIGTWIPANKAAQTEPAEALRDE